MPADAAKRLPTTTSLEISREVVVGNLFAASAGIAALAGSLLLFTGADVIASVGGAISGVLDSLSGRVTAFEFLQLLRDISENSDQFRVLGRNIENLTAIVQRFSEIEFNEGIFDTLKQLQRSLNFEVNVDAGILERGLGFFTGKEISLFTALVQLAEIADPMKIFADAVNLAASSITSLGNAITAFSPEKFTEFADTVKSPEFQELQTELNNSGVVTAAVFAGQLEEAVSAEISRQVGATAVGGGDGSPVVIQNNTSPVRNNFSVNSSLTPTTTDLELMKTIGYGSILDP